MSIEWDEGEKFYDYTEWLEYPLEKFLIPWGYVLNGSVEWKGDESGDLGIIDVTDNKMSGQAGPDSVRITFKRGALVPR